MRILYPFTTIIVSVVVVEVADPGPTAFGVEATGLAFGRIFSTFQIFPDGTVDDELISNAWLNSSVWPEQLNVVSTMIAISADAEYNVDNFIRAEFDLERVIIIKPYNGYSFGDPFLPSKILSNVINK